MQAPSSMEDPILEGKHVELIILESPLVLLPTHDQPMEPRIKRMDNGGGMGATTLERGRRKSALKSF